MARFFPALDLAEFRSEGEFTLFQELAALDDKFAVIHSLPWLRGRTKRVYSQELQKYLRVSLARKHLTGEVDFVILHAELGMLCIETKSGLYKPSGFRFIHERGYEIDPLTQVRDNTFVLREMLQSWQVKCPVGYAVHFPDFDLESSQIASAFVPLNRQLPDGILILQKHRRDIPSRIVQLMAHWKTALNYGNQHEFSHEIERFLEAVWPREARVGHLGRKIVADGELWLRLDDKQANEVALCLDADRRLIAGFSGSGKTLIARSVAEQFAAQDLKVLFLLKNRQITQKVSTQLSHLGRAVTVQTFHSYCESLGTRNRGGGNLSEPNYDEHHLALHGKVDRQYAVLIVDEAQALNEADHLALRDHFANARKFVFADELQVLPGIEKGSSYRFLEDTYDERFFYLATVYRNPGGITQTMIDMRPPRHQVNCPRPISREDLSRSTSKDVSKSIQVLMAELSKAGVKTQDMIVLSQFPLSLEGVDVSRSTISAYRGMEKPVVIVVAGSEMDDTTLACAIGRATTRAYIIVPIELRVGLSGVKSDFLRNGLERIDLAKVLDQDADDPDPRFIANKVRKFAGEIGRHETFGEGFFYASRWRRWVYEGGATWTNRGAQLWGWWLSLSTCLPISGIDPVRNDLSDCYLRPCAECDTTTPHDAHRTCLTCLASPLDEARISAIVLQAVELGVVQSSTRWLSLIKVAALVGSFPFSRSNDTVRGMTEVPVLFLATTIVEFRMRRGATVATKSQMEQWLREVLVASELDDSIESLTGRTISSLCGQKLLEKIGTGRYQLMEPTKASQSGAP